MLLGVVGVSGCMSEVTIEERMKAYMEEKYGDSFEVAGPVESSLGSGRIYRIMTSDQYPDQEVLVCFQKDEARGIFLDNYVALKYQTQAAKRFEEVCTQVWPETKIHTEQVPGRTVLPEAFGPETTLEEYTSWPGNDDYYNVFVRQRKGLSEAESDSQLLRQALESAKMAVRIYLYYGEDQDQYQWMACLEMDDKFQYCREEWKEGS